MLAVHLQNVFGTATGTAARQSAEKDELVELHFHETVLEENDTWKFGRQ